MKKQKIIVSAIALISLFSLTACGYNRENQSGKAKTTLKVALVPGTGGVNDRSFNQSAWEGLQDWGKENNLKKGVGYNYYQSNSDSEYITNYNSAEQAGYKLLFGIGYSLQDATTIAAENNPDSNFVIIDSVITSQKNVASATFADNESAYLAGVAAAKASKTNKIGFIGGMESDIVTHFEKGYIAGAKSIKPNIQVKVQYSGTFTDAAKTKTIAAAMYASGNDVIFQCAGNAGSGAFNEAKSLNNNRKESDKVWLIGVDQDQKYLGKYTSKDGKKSNFVLVSTIKEVGEVVKDISEKTKNNKFPSEEVIKYDLKNGGVSLALDNVTSEIKNSIIQAKEKIVSGKIIVPEK